MKATIEPALTAGFRTMVTKALTIGLYNKGDIECRFDNATGLTNCQTPKKELYIVGDLAFYAMVMGRESSSGHHCYLCKMSAKEFRDLAKRGERWTFEAMNLLVRQAGDTVKGCKEDAWWQFIPVENFLVPLLHTLIGIGNAIFGHFKDMINDKIECLDPKEISVRQKVIQCEEAIQINVAKRED